MTPEKRPATGAGTAALAEAPARAADAAQVSQASQTAQAAAETGRKKKKKRKRKRSKWGFLLAFVLKMAFFAVAGYAVWTYVGIVARVGGNEMFPSAKDGDACVVYRLADVYVGDVVAYDDGKGGVKFARVAAIGGQEIDFPEGGGYRVNGYQPNEQVTYPTFSEPKSAVKYPLEIGEGEYFVLNDFRSDTNDSRSFGVLGDEDVIGKVVFLFRRRSF